MADNILDDVDEILGVSEEDKNFNESELQDIMSEIEDLEKEFDTVVEVTPISLQEKIDAELAMELEEIANAEIVTEEITDDEFTAIEEEVVAPKAQVLAFEKTKPAPAPAPASSPSTSKSEVSFAAHGQMTLNLDFIVGSETAKLSVDPVKGLIVTLSGVELCINEDSGCTVSMENGMKFTIPLASPSVSTKKKTA
ncbi:MAG: hypothetical protein H7177_09470 [Rhizobacter sp.]|nr:hypothetical protein [Bacteriovorax sp.]